MKRLLCLGAFVAVALTGNATFAADECAKITATGHPQYPVIAYKDGDNIAGAAPMVVEAIAKDLKVPLESKFMGSWADAQAAARDGKADMIFGIYYNDERAAYLDYVKPAFMFDDVAIFVAKGKEFPFKGQNDLVGKKGVTNKGESYGTEFDAFMKDKLDVARAEGINDAFKALLDGKADYLIAGYYPGVAEVAKDELKDKVVVLDQALLTAEMFVAFSKKSPCRSLVEGFGKGITEMTTDGRFDAMLTDAQKAYANQAPKRPVTRRCHFNPKGGTWSSYLICFDRAPPYHLIGFPKAWPLGASAVARYGSVLRIPSPIQGSFQRRRLQLVRIASGSQLILNYAARIDQNWRTVRSARRSRERGMLLAFPAQAAGPAASVCRQSCRQGSLPDQATIGRGDLKVSIQASNLRAVGAVRMSTGCRGERLPLRRETDRQFSVRHTVAASP